MNLDKFKKNTFEEIKHIDTDGQEYWLARDFSKVLDYSEYRHFKSVIEKAKDACENSQQKLLDHFEEVLDMVEIGSGAVRELDDVKQIEKSIKQIGTKN